MSFLQKFEDKLVQRAKVKSIPMDKECPQQQVPVYNYGEQQKVPDEGGNEWGEYDDYEQNNQNAQSAVYEVGGQEESSQQQQQHDVICLSDKESEYEQSVNEEAKGLKGTNKIKESNEEKEKQEKYREQYQEYEREKKKNIDFTIKRKIIQAIKPYENRQLPSTQNLNTNRLSPQSNNSQNSQSINKSPTNIKKSQANTNNNNLCANNSRNNSVQKSGQEQLPQQSKKQTMKKPKVATINNLLKISDLGLPLKDVLLQIKLRSTPDDQILPINLLYFFIVQKILFQIYKKNCTDYPKFLENQHLVKQQITKAFIQFIRFMPKIQRQMIKKVIPALAERLQVKDKDFVKIDTFLQQIKNYQKQFRSTGVDIQALMKPSVIKDVTPFVFNKVDQNGTKYDFRKIGLKLEDENLCTQRIHDSRVYRPLCEQRLFYFREPYTAPNISQSVIQNAAINKNIQLKSNIKTINKQNLKSIQVISSSSLEQPQQSEHIPDTKTPKPTPFYNPNSILPTNPIPPHQQFQERPFKIVCTRVKLPQNNQKIHTNLNNLHKPHTPTPNKNQNRQKSQNIKPSSTPIPSIKPSKILRPVHIQIPVSSFPLNNQINLSSQQYLQQDVEEEQQLAPSRNKNNPNNPNISSKYNRNITKKQKAYKNPNKYNYGQNTVNQPQPPQYPNYPNYPNYQYPQSQQSQQSQNIQNIQYQRSIIPTLTQPTTISIKPATLPPPPQINKQQIKQLIEEMIFEKVDLVAKKIEEKWGIKHEQVKELIKEAEIRRVMGMGTKVKPQNQQQQQQYSKGNGYRQNQHIPTTNTNGMIYNNNISQYPSRNNNNTNNANINGNNNRNGSIPPSPTPNQPVNQNRHIPQPQPQPRKFQLPIKPLSINAGYAGYGNGHGQGQGYGRGHGLIPGYTIAQMETHLQGLKNDSNNTKRTLPTPHTQQVQNGRGSAPVSPRVNNNSNNTNGNVQSSNGKNQQVQQNQQNQQFQQFQQNQYQTPKTTQQQPPQQPQQQQQQSVPVCSFPPKHNPYLHQLNRMYKQLLKQKVSLKQVMANCQNWLQSKGLNPAERQTLLKELMKINNIQKIANQTGNASSNNNSI